MINYFMNIQSLACSEPLKQALAEYTDGFVKTLGDDLIGLYIYGSLARGCYHPATSDVDIIAVIKESAINPDSQVILQIHRNAGVPMDTVFADERQINTDICPTPLRFLVGTGADYIGFFDVPDRIYDVPEGRSDFLPQRQDVYEAGITLHGPAPQDIIRPVPWPVLAQSLDFLFPYIVTNFKNSVLMLCRIAYAWTHRKLSGKQQAGEWAAEAFGDQWNPVIKKALAEYAEGVKTGIPPQTLRDFETHCANYISSLR
ncbi:MAG: DUF4111 domain-containing protein [Armatimonadota bacterium]|nr:DUF4111 domain-containing protein [Armatimonadota bacterium]